MDENQEGNQMPQPQMEEQKTPDVGFPVAQPKQKNSGGRLVLVGLILVILIGGAIFLFTRASKKSGEGISPTPTVAGVETPFPTEATGTPTSVDKSEVTIQALNGTGIAGEAAYLQGVLKDLGYSDIKVGNADSQDGSLKTTTVTFSRSLSSSITDEITTKLKSIYQNVETKTSSTQTTDVVITTGLREGATPKPTSTATPTATPTTTTTATPTATPTTTTP